MVRPLPPEDRTSQDVPDEPRDGLAPAPENGGVEQQVTVSQDRLGKLLTREKAQGERAAIRRLLASLGFDSPKDLTEFVAAQREAEQAALSEVERREQAAKEREMQAARREAAAAERERSALRRAVLVGLGAEGDDLADAERLLDVDDEADEPQVQAASEALKGRRPELFGRGRVLGAAAPAGAPAGRGPSRTAVVARPGAAGLEMARRRGLTPSDEGR
ncbi:hypothetical protein [Streptomyces sp. NPDC014733]|uniref:hypothetical protein n=1 Tax=Streptomyces sp. NPDC014733 TaxID=3364885 RepID=UPI0036F55D40